MERRRSGLRILVMFIPSYHHGIGYEVLQLAGRHGYAGENSPVRGAYNGFGAQPGDEGEAGVDAHLHQEGIEGNGRLLLCEVAAEYGVRHAGDDHETAEEDGNDDQVEEPYLPVRRKSHDEGADDGDGRLCGHAQYHHDGVLHVHDVRRHARDEAVGGEFVDVRKGKVLDAAEHPVPQVPGEPGRGPGGAEARHSAEH